MTSADMTYYLFTLFSGLRILSYMPQIYCIARDKSGAAVISYWTWGIWTAANAFTAAYVFVSLNDMQLAIINMINTLCCGIVIGLTIFKRRQFSQRCARGEAVAINGGSLGMSGMD